MSTFTHQFIDLLRTQFDAPADTTVKSRYEDMELDSLSLVELAVTLCQRYDVDVTDSEIYEVGTVGATIDLLHAKGVFNYGPNSLHAPSSLSGRSRLPG